MSTTTDLSVLKINYLTQAQYDNAKSQGTLEANEIYMTPVTDPGVTDVEVDGVSVVTDGVAEITMPTVPTKVSQLQNDSGYITGYTETDPTVPSWAKASSKPTYTYSEVGAAASSHSHGNITNGGDITATAPTIASGDQIVINDNSASKITNGPTFDGSTTTKALTPKGTWETFLQSYTETDPTVPAWAKASSKPSYTASEVGAVPTSRTVNGKALSSNITLSASDVSALPASTSIPSKTSDLTNDSDFVVDASYVHTDNNFTSTEKSKLSGIASGAEVNVQADWNVTSTSSDAYIKNKPTIPTVPTNVSAFTNDAGYLTSYTETDPVFSASAASGISSSDIANWNNLEAFKGNVHFYNDYSEATGETTLLGKIQSVINGISSTTTTAFNVVINNYGQHLFSGIVYADKSYGTGIIHGITTPLLYRWLRDYGNDYLYPISQGALVITVASFSSLPQTVSDNRITDDMVCLKAELGTPSAQTGDWTVTTSAGSLTISGSISGSTTATLYLARKEN